MPFTELVSPQAIIPALKANSKKQALQDLASKAAEITGRPEREILDVLTQREKLGSTALGAGIAIPHGKLSKLERIHGIFARLERPIDFEALDGQPVDLVFVLLAPESAGADHLKALSRIARMLRDQNSRQPASRCPRCGGNPFSARQGNAAGDVKPIRRRETHQGGIPKRQLAPASPVSARSSSQARCSRRSLPRLRGCR